MLDESKDEESFILWSSDSLFIQPHAGSEKWREDLGEPVIVMQLLDEFVARQG